jgi:rubrerythrin
MNEFIELLLQKINENEQAISRLYRQFAQSFPGDAAIWEAIAEDEDRHSGWLDQLLAICKAGKIRAGSGGLRLEAVESMLDYVHSVTENCAEGKLHRENVFAIAFDIENSLLERKFFSALESDSREFRLLSQEIIRETYRHRAEIGKLLEAIRSSR